MATGRAPHSRGVGGALRNGRGLRPLVFFLSSSAIAPALATLLSVLAVLGTWRYLEREYEGRTHERIAAQRDQLIMSVRRQLQFRLLTLERMAGRWLDANGTPQTLWEADAARYVSDFGDLQAVEWADTEFRVKWIYPMEGNEAALDLNLAFEARRRAALTAARDSGRFTASESLDLVQGGKGFIIFAPIGARESFQGFILGVFRTQAFFDQITGSLHADYLVEVRELGEALYSSETPIRADMPLGMAHDVQLDALGNNWTLRLTPKPEFLQTQRSDVPSVALIAGLVLSAMLGAVLFLGLRSHERKLEIQGSESKYRSLVEAVPIGLVSVDDDGLITHVNPEAERQVGYRSAELLGRPFSVLLPLGERTPQPEDVSQFVQKARSSEGGGRLIWTGRRKGGEEFIGEVALNVIEDGGRHTVLAAIVDITARRAAEKALRGEVIARRKVQEELAVLNRDLEDRVARRTEDLESANLELEEFTRVASHDLQAPLRKQRMFVDVLRSALPFNTLNGDGQLAMGAIETSAHRMQKLVQGLLALARARNRGLRISNVPLDSVVDDALDALAPQLQETSAHIDREPLPTIACDRILLSLVFQNLVENALKFQNGSRPIVKIWSEESNAATVVHLRDNGIGIAPEWRSRVFEPFRRLYTDVEYEGSGIGLSICKKIVERHGGTIRVADDDGPGAHFVITIPKTGGQSQNDPARSQAREPATH